MTARDHHLELRDIADPRVLDAMRKVPRDRFVPVELRARAFDDSPLPIGYEQTISQPYIVALMSQLADVKAGDRILEIGTGSGYQSAILAELGAEIFTVEIIQQLAKHAKTCLSSLGYDRVHVRHGDGYKGWPEHAPFDGVIVTAAPPQIPLPLFEQLKVGAHLVIPVGRETQELRVVTRKSDGFDERTITPVRFVPMTGEAQKKRPPEIERSSIMHRNWVYLIAFP